MWKRCLKHASCTDFHRMTVVYPPGETLWEKGTPSVRNSQSARSNTCVRNDNKTGNYDYETSTHKEFAVVRGGVRTLARWAGVAEKLVTEWLRDPVFSAFVCMANMCALDVPDSSCLSGTQIFLVSQTEPLLGELFDGQPWCHDVSPLKQEVLQCRSLNYSPC